MIRSRSRRNQRPRRVTRQRAPRDLGDETLRMLVRLTCCSLLETEALRRTLSGEWPWYRYDHARGTYQRDPVSSNSSAGSNFAVRPRSRRVVRRWAWLRAGKTTGFVAAGALMSTQAPRKVGKGSPNVAVSEEGDGHLPCLAWCRA